MMPFTGAGAYEPCICVDGPLKGTVSTIACLLSGLPADYKYFKDGPDNDCRVYKYMVGILGSGSDARHEKNDSGGWALYYVDSLPR